MTWDETLEAMDDDDREAFGEWWEGSPEAAELALVHMGGKCNRVAAVAWLAGRQSNESKVERAMAAKVLRQVADAIDPARSAVAKGTGMPRGRVVGS